MSRIMVWARVGSDGMLHVPLGVSEANQEVRQGGIAMLVCHPLADASQKPLPRRSHRQSMWQERCT